MKERIGFVSNSSSSSFIITGKIIPGVNDQIVKFLEGAYGFSRKERIRWREDDLKYCKDDPEETARLKAEIKQLEDESLVYFELSIPYGIHIVGNLDKLLGAFKKVPGFEVKEEG